MKKIIVFLYLMLILPVFAFEVPAGKNINQEAVIKGIEKYTQAVNNGSKSEDVYINRAFLYFLQGNYTEAISDYDSLIRINPDNEEFYLNRGYLKHISNNQIEALKDYDMALKINPNYAFAYNNRGVALSELGRNNDSLIAYNTAIKIDPNYADAYYNRGNLKTKTEKNQEALEDFNQAIKLNPTDSASFNNRGVVKRKLNFNVGALSDFSIAIKLNPDDITAFANRGRLKKRYYDSEGAEEDFKIAIAIAEEIPVKRENSTNSNLVNNIKKDSFDKPVLRDSKVTSDGIQKIAYVKADEEKSSDINITSVKASVVQVEAGKKDLNNIPIAIKKAEPVISNKPVPNPKLAECYYIRALQKYILQNRESALKDFNLAIEHNPDYAEAYYYRAAIKRDFQDEGFVDDYRKAIQLNPELRSVNDADVLTILKN